MAAASGTSALASTRWCRADSLKGLRLSAEWLQPIEDHPNGFQPRRDGTIWANASMAFWGFGTLGDCKCTRTCHRHAWAGGLSCLPSCSYDQPAACSARQRQVWRDRGRGSLVASDCRAAPRSASRFLTIKNEGKTEDRLISAASPIAARAEIHETKTENDMMTMRPVSGGIAIPPRGSVALAPSGYQLMFADLRGATEGRRAVQGHADLRACRRGRGDLRRRCDRRRGSGRTPSSLRLRPPPFSSSARCRRLRAPATPRRAAASARLSAPTCTVYMERRPRTQIPLRPRTDHGRRGLGRSVP